MRTLILAIAVLAWIGLSGGHAFVQPADASVELFHNQQRISESAWLKSGDQIDVGEAHIRWVVRGDQVHVQVSDRQAVQQQLKPPATSPPTAAQCNSFPFDRRSCWRAPIRVCRVSAV